MYNQAKKLNIHSIVNTENHIEIKTATSLSEKEAIYRFRYQVYVEELKTPLHSADQKIFDEIDEDSILLYAQIGSNIIGTARMTIYSENQFPEWLSKVFQLKKFSNMLYDYQNKHLGLATKIAVLPAYRGSTVMYRLIAEIYKLFMKYQVEFSFSGGNPRMIQLYERVGYRRFTQNFTEPGYGLLVPLVFIHDDIAHLKAVHSPLYRLAPKDKKSVLTRRFYQTFPKATKQINSQLKDVSLQYIYSLFNNNIEYFSPLKNLNEQERITLIQLGAIFHCTKGDIITTVGEISNELYFLLSGSLYAKTSSTSYSIYPGECFGYGVTGSKPYESTIIANTESDLLILSNDAWGKFKNLYPNTAQMIL